MELDTVLAAIGSTEPSTFYEFCRALGDDCPEAGDREGWRPVMSAIDLAERSGFVTVDRVKGKIDSMQLTDAGANRVRDKLDSERGLISYIDQR